MAGHDDIVQHYRDGKAMQAIRNEKSGRGYLAAVQADKRFGSCTPRAMQYLLGFVDACDRCGITASDLAQHPEIKLGSVRARVKNLRPPKARALEQLVTWSADTQRQAVHKIREATHPSFGDGVAAVVRAIGRDWAVTFAVERGKQNFDWRVVSGLGEGEAVGLLVGVSWPARALWILAVGADARLIAAIVEHAGQLGTEVIEVVAEDPRATLAGATEELGLRAGRPSLARVCQKAGWREPQPEETGEHHQDVERAICLLVHARSRRR